MTDRTRLSVLLSDTERVKESERDIVTELDSESLASFVWLRVADATEVTESVVLMLTVREALRMLLIEDEALNEADGSGDALSVALTDLVPDFAEDAVRLLEWERDAERTLDSVTDSEPIIDCVEESLVDRECDSLLDREALSLGDALCDAELDWEYVALTSLDSVRLRLRTSDTDTEAVCERERDTECVRDKDLTFDAETDCVSLGDSVTLSEADGTLDRVIESLVEGCDDMLEVRLVSID